MSVRKAHATAAVHAAQLPARPNTLSDLVIDLREIASLRPAARLVRTHSKKQIALLAKSIAEFGWTVPILIDDTGQILAGHARVAAAKSLGHTSVPTICLSSLSEVQKRAYVIADNRLAELAGWDRELLLLEFKEMAALDIDLTSTAFSTAEIDLVIEGEADWEPADEVTVPSPGLAAVSRPGGLWLLGRHRLLCGDSLAKASYETVLANEKAEMVFTDPPYNVRVDGHVSGLGNVQHREFAMASGEMTRAEFTAFLTKVFGEIAVVCVDGAIVFACMDWRHVGEIEEAGRAAFSELKNICVWVKDNAGMGTLYRSQHEFVFAFKAGTASHVNNVELGRYGRSRSNVWNYRGVNTFKTGRMDELTLHPTVKPVALIVDTMRDCSKRGDLVLDPFSGSGSTIIAGEQVGRRVAAIEIDPLYCDAAVRRWQKQTGKDAIDAATERTFDDIAADKESEAGDA